MKGRIAGALFLSAIGLAVSPLSSSGGPSGSVTGSITGTVTAPGLRDAANTVVYIASAPGQYAPPPPVVLDQRNIQFSPHVVPIVVGTTVKFLNSDDVQHNVFTPSQAGDLFNLGTWPKGESKPYTFKKMGRVDLLCNVHHEMRGYVLVLQNPFFAVTGKDGRFHIDNVPPGQYQLKVWHERGSAPAVPIQMSAGSVGATFELAAR